ncbi:MAG TPA: CoA-binding protein [Firmicutes bacterium]|jgi:predicted CoA-binding protein|nr:CoA-binding protein [Bacillota bacterium]
MIAAIKRFLAAKSIAVVGVSRSDEKYGTKVYRLLTKHGYDVTGINPRMSELDGRMIYPSIADMPQKPEAVVIVVPPQIAVETIKEAAAAGITQVWLQPGAESPEAIEVAAELDMSLIYDSCIMVQSTANLSR